jgi:hypothetical protein
MGIHRYGMDMNGDSYIGGGIAVIALVSLIELMAWWCATLKDGGKTPSEEDLRLKVEGMKMLRF